MEGPAKAGPFFYKEKPPRMVEVLKNLRGIKNQCLDREVSKYEGYGAFCSVIVSHTGCKHLTGRMWIGRRRPPIKEAPIEIVATAYEVKLGPT